MTIFKKPMDDPEVVAHLKTEGKTLLQVQFTCYYLIDAGHTDMTIEQIVQDWFVDYRGRSHAWRDGCHVGGGGDMATEVKVLTEEGRVIAVKHEARPATKPA